MPYEIREVRNAAGHRFHQVMDLLSSDIVFECKYLRDAEQKKKELDLAEPMVGPVRSTLPTLSTIGPMGAIAGAAIAAAGAVQNATKAFHSIREKAREDIMQIHSPDVPLLWVVSMSQQRFQDFCHFMRLNHRETKWLGPNEVAWRGLFGKGATLVLLKVPPDWLVPGGHRAAELEFVKMQVAHLQMQGADVLDEQDFEAALLSERDQRMLSNWDPNNSTVSGP